MIARSQPILAADIAPLATLANSVLLPIVNTAVAASGWPATDQYAVGTAPTFYDKRVTDFVPVNPQPVYAFSGGTQDWLEEINRIRGDLMTLFQNKGFGVDYLYLNPDFLVSGPWCVAVNDPVTFPYYSYGVATPSVQGNLLGGTGTGFCAYKGVSYIYALNDALGGLSITGHLKGGFSFDYLSTPTPNLTSSVSSSVNGALTLSFTITISGSGTPPLVSALGLTASAGSVAAVMTSGGTSPVYTVTVSAIPVNPSGLTFDFSFTLPGGWTSGPAPFVAQSADMVFGTWNKSVLTNAIHPSSAARKLVCDTVPAGIMPALSISNGSRSSVSYASAEWDLSDKTVKGVWTATTLPIPGQNVFIGSDMPPYVSEPVSSITSNPPSVTVSEEVSGWIANGFPSLDNPPTTQPDNALPEFLDSQQQQAVFAHEAGFNFIHQSTQGRPAPWLVRRDTDFVPLDFGYNLNESHILYSNQPTSGGIIANYYTLNLSTAFTLKGLKLKVVQAGSAKIGWSGGQLSYGLPAAAFSILVVARGGDYPDPTDPTSYDFASATNSVTIPTDGGFHYIQKAIANGTLNFAILSSAPQTYDLVIEFDYELNPARTYFPQGGNQYWPNAMECFSHFIDGRPPVALQAVGWYKPVPQSGYCIFKIRATRMPVKNAGGISVTPSSGAPLAILIGQNQLQTDGTLKFAPFAKLEAIEGAGSPNGPSGQEGAGGSGSLFTLSIPSNARDTGDVDVFWTVLSGNELVYQCSEQVVLETWANWQPIFFSRMYGIYQEFTVGSGTSLGYFSDPTPTFLPYCLAFSNWFDGYLINRPNDTLYGSIPVWNNTRTQFPVSVEIYNDLLACLALI